MVRIAPRLKERLIADVSAYIFRRAAASSGNAARILYAFRAGHWRQDQPVLPVITEVVLLEDLKAGVGSIGKPQVAKVHLGRLDHPGAIGILFEVFGRADDQIADDELVQVAVSPPSGRLQHLVELREIEVARQFQGAAANRLDPEDLDFEPDDEVLGIKVTRHTAVMPLHRATRRFEGTMNWEHGPIRTPTAPHAHHARLGRARRMTALPFEEEASRPLPLPFA